MTIALRGVTAPTSISAYKQIEYGSDGQGRETGAVTFSAMPNGITLSEHEAKRLGQFLLGMTVDEWQPDTQEQAKQLVTAGSSYADGGNSDASITSGSAQQSRSSSGDTSAGQNSPRSMDYGGHGS